MERIYYVEKDDETAETSSRLEATQISAEWKKRGYDVTTVVVDMTESSVVTLAQDAIPASGRYHMHPRPTRPVGAARLTGAASRRPDRQARAANASAH